MKEVRFADFIAAHVDIDIEIVREVLAVQKKISLKSGDYLLRQGEINRNSYFVEKGLLKYSSIDNKEKEHILQFAPERWFISDRESAMTNKPSKYFIEALEDSSVVVIDDDFLLAMAAKYPPFGEFYYKLLQSHIRSLQNRVNQLLSYTAEERYLELIRIYPNIQQRVPQMMIASYLGITPESLSRVRKEIVSKNSKR